MTRRMFLAAPLAAVAGKRIPLTATSLPVRGWTYWHQRFPRGGFETGRTEPGRHYDFIGALTVPGHRDQLVWRHQ